MRFFITVVSLSFFLNVSAQREELHSSIDINYFKGNIALHNDGILHLINGHPEGLIIAWNRHTYGEKSWHQRYNYPDYGISASYQDLKTDELGENFGLYGHFNFYFLNRKLMFRVGQGLALTSNPYDRVENPRNNAFGSKIMSSTYVMLNYRIQRLFEKIGFQAGLSMIHYSNANVKAPNTSVNSITANLGVVYDLSEQNKEYAYDLSADEKYTEPIRFNLVFRSGINESDVVGSGQFPFYIFSVYADKRINHKSALHFGSDLFFSNFLKELIKYSAVAFPENDVDEDTDYKRAGVFIGHELFIDKLSLVTQLGYYVYYPFDFEGRTYQRIGLNYYINDNWFASLSLKSHAAKAEAVELGIGVRL